MMTVVREVLFGGRGKVEGMRERMEATDRKGLLNAITSALRKLNCEVLSGSIATKDGIANNRLVIAAPSNMKSETIRLAVEALVK